MTQTSPWKAVAKGALLLVLALFDVRGQQPGRAITVIIRDQSGLRPATLSRMNEDLTRIFSRVGITVRIADGAPAEAAGAHSASTGSCWFELRIVPDAKPKMPGVLGTALLGERSGQYAVLHLASIWQVALEACWGEAELMARVAAHEIGHLLLDSPEHAGAGLMQANWSPRYLLMIPHSQLEFLPREAQLMHLRLTSETAQYTQQVT
jgi:hypothetical protein